MHEATAVERQRVTAIVECAMTIFGWCEGEAAHEAVRTCLALPSRPTIVQIGVFLGRSTALLAGACRARGDAKVHCIDPLDGSGDAFSVPYYLAELANTGYTSVETAFIMNMRRLDLGDWIELSRLTGQEAARSWSRPVDLLWLDADQSPQGARDVYEAWVPYLRPGGALVVRNTADRAYAPGHDGHRRLVLEEVQPPAFRDVRQIEATTFAVKAE